MTSKNTNVKLDEQFPWFTNEITDVWMRFANQQLQYINTMNENMERLGVLTATRIRENFDETARLGKTWVDYSTTVANECRQVAMDTAQRIPKPFQKN